MADSILFEHVVVTEGSSFLVRYDEECMENVMDYHIHPEWELQYVYKGQGHRVLGGVIEPSQEGEIVLVPANMPHTWLYENPTGNPDYKIKEYCIQFREEIFTEKLAVLPEFQDLADYLKHQGSAVEILGETAKEIRKLIRKMHQENSVSRLILLIEILMRIKDSSEVKFIHAQEGGGMHEKQLSQIQEVLVYMMNQMHREISLDEIASHFYMSKSSFCSFFKKATGKTFSFSLNELRLNRAAILLINQPQKSINEVAFEVGYSSISHFNHLFRNMKGISPSEYRKGILSKR